MDDVRKEYEWHAWGCMLKACIPLFALFITLVFQKLLSMNPWAALHWSDAFRWTLAVMSTLACFLGFHLARRQSARRRKRRGAGA